MYYKNIYIADRLTITHFNDIVDELSESERYSLYYELGMSENEISDAKIGNDPDEIFTEQARQVILYWCQKKPQEATIGGILNALTRCGNNLMRQTYEQMWIKDGRQGRLFPAKQWYKTDKK